MAFQYTLYGDGIHDDLPAIQEMLDSGMCEVCLPVPEKHYLLSSTLFIPANTKLKLPRFAEIRLADGANCIMVQSKSVDAPENRIPDESGEFLKKFFYYSNAYSTNPRDVCCNIAIEGGIWNFNNMNQLPNPIISRDFGPSGHWNGHGMLFFNVRNLLLTNMTMKDPSNFAITMEYTHYFTVENIIFDFNTGNPFSTNMDGIHLNGNCSHGVIRNLQGACYDDLVALNAHEGVGGDITYIEIDGIFAENCHSAVRLLTVKDVIRNIRISNVFGSYYQYCIGFTKFYPGETTGYFDAIVLDNISASKSKRQPLQEMHMGNGKGYVFPFIWLQEDTHHKSLTINGVHRREREVATDTIHIGKTAKVERLVVHDVTLENFIEQPSGKFVNHGEINNLYTDLSSEEIVNDGTIGKIL